MLDTHLIHARYVLITRSIRICYTLEHVKKCGKRYIYIYLYMCMYMYMFLPPLLRELACAPSSRRFTCRMLRGAQTSASFRARCFSLLESDRSLTPALPCKKICICICGRSAVQVKINHGRPPPTSMVYFWSRPRRYKQVEANSKQIQANTKKHKQIQRSYMQIQSNNKQVQASTTKYNKIQASQNK